MAKSEKKAAVIAQENLARTAGYSDPMRLKWAMEARAIADCGVFSMVLEGIPGVKKVMDVKEKVEKVKKIVR